MKNQSAARADKGLSRYVGVKEVCAALGISKPTLDRKRRDGDFPPHEQLSPNRVGWRIEVIEQHFSKQARSMANLAVTNPDDLEPEQLESQALDFAVRAQSMRTGQPVDPADHSLHLARVMSADEFFALEAEEHRIRAKYLAQLTRDQAMIVVAALLPQLQPALEKVASPRARKALKDRELIGINFKLISNFLVLFELATRLSENGLTVPPGQTAFDRLAEFDQARALVLSAWMFPVLRPLIANSAESEAASKLFADPDLLRDMAMAALDDDKWAIKQAKLQARQRDETTTSGPRGPTIN